MSKPKKLPFDSPNWIPLTEAYRLLRARFDSPGLARTQLDDAVRAHTRNGHVPTMRRCFLYDHKGDLIGPERELLKLEHWDERRLWVGLDDSLEVVEGPFRSTARPVIVRGVARAEHYYASVKGYAYFAWKPALAKVWPDVFAPTTTTPTAVPEIDDSRPRRRRRRRKPKPPEAEKAKPREATPPAPKQPTASKSREQEACRQFAVRKYPHGYNSIRTSVIMHAAELDKEFKQTVVPFPKRDVWLRALGRRKR